MRKLRSSLYLIFFIIVFLSLIIVVQHLTEQTKFRSLTKELIKHTYEDDALSSHFTFLNPSEFGIEQMEDTSLEIKERHYLPIYEKKVYLSEATYTKQCVEKLMQIDKVKLSASAKQTYSILEAYLKQKELGLRYLYFEEPLSPTSGVHASLPVILSEYEIKNEQDICNYLNLLKDIPAYFEGLARYEADRAEKGLFMSSEDTNLVISQCEFMAGEQGKKLFSDCFKNNLTKLSFLSEGEKQDYQVEHEKIFNMYVSDAYDKLADSLLLLKDKGKDQRGLFYESGGKDYYAFHVKQVVGTDKSVEQMEALLKKRIQDLTTEFNYERTRYLSLHPSISQNEIYSNQDENMDSIECLEALKDAMCERFPKLSTTGHVTVKQIPQALLEYTAPAYYFVPRIGICHKKQVSNINNVIYVNPDAKNDAVNLFTTLAHEGYPGHMYQNICFLSEQGVSKDNILRYCIDFPGYSEGWAMYVELLSYDYVDQCVEGLDKEYINLQKLTRELQLSMLSYLDIQIHYYGYLLPDIAPILAQIGIKDAQTLHDVYTYIVNEPGTYMKYYVGYLELIECKKLYYDVHKDKVEQEKVNHCNDVSFHTFFLSNGPNRYDEIREKIKADVK